MSGWSSNRIDARPLALLRIGLGSLVLADLADRLRDFHAFYTSAALVPASPGLVGASRLPHWSLLGLSDDPRVTLAIYLLAFPAALLVLLGLFTRPALVATLAALISLHHRNSYVDGGGDAVLRALAFWLIAVDSGARLSLDVKLGRRPARSFIPALPVVLLQLQIAVVYVFAFLGKTGPGWRDGSAVVLALTTSDWARGAGAWLATHPLLCRGLSQATLVIEAAFAPLVFWPRRLWPHNHWPRALALGAGLALHAGIFFTMRVGNFSEAMVLSYLAFLPGLPARWLDRFIPNDVPGPALADLPPPPPRAVGPVLIVAFALVLAGQLTSVFPGAPPRPLAIALETAGMRQDWRVFAPDAPRLDVTFTAPGHLTSGAPLELTNSVLQGLAPQRRFRYSRWHRLRNRLTQGAPALTAAVGRYTCRATPHLAAFDLHAHLKSPGTAPTTELLLHQDCGAVPAPARGSP